MVYFLKKQTKEQLMSSINDVMLIGCLGRDPEVVKAGTKNITRLNIATERLVTLKSGEKKRQVEWHRVNVWDRIGEVCAKQLFKGRRIAVQGYLKTSSWKNSKGEKCYSTEVRARYVIFLDDKKKEEKEPMLPGENCDF